MRLRCGRLHHITARAALIVALVLLVSALGACSESPIDAFCDRARTASEVGPLFPARTDGEPVPDLEALSGLEAMAAAAPSEIAPEMQILADEAQALVNEVENREKNGSFFPPSDRSSRRAVERAQSAVIDYSDTHCDVVLTQTVRSGSQGPRHLD